MLKMIGIAPHPPIIIPEIGRGEIKKVQKTVAALQRLSRKIKEQRPQLLIIITPHGPVMHEGPSVATASLLHGNFSRFGAPQIKVELETDLQLVEYLRAETKEDRLKPVFLPAGDFGSERQGGLDHGAMVPLYYLQQEGLNLPGLHITYGYNSYQDLYHFGCSLRRAADKRGLPYVVLASGDLSHRLIPGAPAGFSRRGAEFDQLLVERLKNRAVEAILNFDRQLVEEAGECGLRSFIMALGMLSGGNFSTKIFSYEGPFGVGYLVAALEPQDLSSISFDPVQLARKTLEQYFAAGKTPGVPADLPSEFQQKAGAFVSLKKAGQLRGCIGTIEPVQSNLSGEIAANALSAAFRDPRFPPVQQQELAALDISVDVLSPLEKIGSRDELDHHKYGVMVCSGHKKGLLLPDLEGVDSVEEQLSIAARKAGIDPDEKMELYRFTVTRYKEE